jgi:hypothetical protein
MIHSETKITKLEPEAFQIMESLDTSIYIDLFSKTIISIMGDKHHSHPVISGVTRNLFRATATYNIHNVFSCRTFYRAHCSGVPRATKNRYVLIGEKRDATFHLRVLCYASDLAVFSVATITKIKKNF